MGVESFCDFVFTRAGFEVFHIKSFDSVAKRIDSYYQHHRPDLRLGWGLDREGGYSESTQGGHIIPFHDLLWKRIKSPKLILHTQRI